MEAISNVQRLGSPTSNRFSKGWTAVSRDDLHIGVNPNIKRVFRYFGEAAYETPALLDRLLLTMALMRADIIS